MTYDPSCEVIARRSPRCLQRRLSGCRTLDAPARQECKQIKLTDEAGRRASSPPRRTSPRWPPKLQEAGDKPDPALQAELEGIAKKHGFASFAEFDDVAANISIVMAGLDPQIGGFHRSGRSHEEGARRGQGRRLASPTTTRSS